MLVAEGFRKLVFIDQVVPTSCRNWMTRWLIVDHLSGEERIFRWDLFFLDGWLVQLDQFVSRHNVVADEFRLKVTYHLGAAKIRLL